MSAVPAPCPGILLVAHAPLAGALVQAAETVIGPADNRLAAIDASTDESPGALTARIAETAERLDTGDGVLILIDLMGATPCNAALAAAGPRRRCVTGASLAMLIRVCNHGRLPLAELTRIAAASGARCTLDVSPPPVGATDDVDR